MKVGYPCINTSIGCTANSTFRLASYSEEKLIEKVTQNLKCLKKTLEYNVKNELLFFRIGSGLVPFASHPICTFNWEKYFKKDFEKIGRYIKENDIRISMHPDQFVVINSPKEEVVERSIKEIEYHCKILDLLNLDSSAKVQIHVGGAYGDKKKAINNFIENYKKLALFVKNRLVIENDDHLFSLKDCLEVNNETNIPIIFDNLHHECLNNGESINIALKSASNTWQTSDSIPMIDYSQQRKSSKLGSHTHSINIHMFREFVVNTKDLNFDIMLEIKDKEKSALEAIKCVKDIRKPGN